MLRRLKKPWAIVVAWAGVVLVALYLVYRWVDPLPPHHFAIAAGIAGTHYDEFARHYARILARDGVVLEVRNYPSGLEHFDVLRDAASGVQAGITTFGFTEPRDAEILSSLGGISDSALFIFYRGTEPVTLFSQFRGRRVSIGKPGTALRTLLSEVLKGAGALDSAQLADLDYAEAIDALIGGQIDVAVVSTQLDDNLLQRALSAPGIRLMNVAQAQAISKTVPGLARVVLPQGMVSMSRNIPDSDVGLLAIRNRVLVRKDLHPALQYLLLEAMREVHGPPGAFDRLGEFPAEQPNDLPLSPTAEAFYRSDATFWQRYTAYWLSSLLNRIVFFVIPIVALLIPLIGIAPRLIRWVFVRRIEQVHRALGILERDLERSGNRFRVDDYQARVAHIESAVRSLKVGRPFEVDLHRLKVHLRMVRDDVDRMKAAEYSEQGRADA